MIALPESIVSELLRQQTEMGWPEMVPAFVHLPDETGNVICYHNVTVALCEQLVEHHSRVARFILSNLGRHSPRGKVEDIARNVLLARLFRCRYIELTGQENTTEDDMPFAHNRW